MGGSPHGRYRYTAIPADRPPLWARKKPHKAYRDKYADPKVQLADRLGQFGSSLLQIIINKYPTYIGEWEKAFGKVFEAYAFALGARDKTFEDAQLEREADAARDAFILSLMTAGAMVFVGAWVQYSLVPSATIRSAKWDFSKFPTSVPGLEIVTSERFTKMQAAMFGGLTKEVGGKTIPLAFPKPKAISNPHTSLSLVESLRTDITGKFTDANKMVVDSLTDAQKWMIVDTEFGEAWAAYAGFNEQKARAEIRIRIQTLRDEWAKKWEFFGKSPKEIQVPLLANQYERALWADYIARIFAQLMTKMAPWLPADEKFEWLKLSGDIGVGGHKKFVEAAIVNRLKELNVVLAETTPGKTDQANRMIEGSPRPETHIEGAVDRGYEIDEIYTWASGFLKNARDDTANKFYPPAKLRTLEPL